MHDLTDDSRSTHGAIPDDSHREGKGREGNRKGREIGHLAIPTYEAAAPQCDQEQSPDLHWLLFDRDRLITGCHCGFKAETEEDDGWGDSVVQHLITAGADDLRARLAATEIKLAAARLALAACREVREARDA